jgi:hypothetical protein
MTWKQLQYNSSVKKLDIKSYTAFSITGASNKICMCDLRMLRWEFKIIREVYIADGQLIDLMNWSFSMRNMLGMLPVPLGRAGYSCAHPVELRSMSQVCLEFELIVETATM